MNKNDEIVFALPVDELFAGATKFNGVSFYSDPIILENIYTKSKPMKRGDCENDPTIKHIVPYVVLTSANNNIFVTQRTNNQTEARLANKYSVGIGGHVGPVQNYSVAESIMYGMLREIDEEMTGMDLVNFTTKVFKPSFMGYVNDDLTDVGKVHFGLVYNIFVDSILAKGVRVKETENMVGQWMNYNDALKIVGYENWSCHILNIDPKIN